MTQPPVPPGSIERISVTSPDGTRLSVLVALPAAPRGPSDLPTVLAVHGFGSSAHFTWGATGHLAALAGAGRRVVAPDLRGHGLSDRPHLPAAYPFDALLGDLRAVAAALGGAPLDVLGYSLGARLSWSLAADPELRVRRLVLGGYDGRVLFEGVDPVRLTVRVDPHGRRVGAAADPTERIAGIVHAVPGNDPVALTALVAGLRGTVPHEPEPAMPTLVAAGTDDPLASGAAVLAAGLPNGTYLAIPGRDHINAVPAAVFRHGVVEFLGAARQDDRRDS